MRLANRTIRSTTSLLVMTAMIGGFVRATDCGLHCTPSPLDAGFSPKTVCCCSMQTKECLCCGGKQETQTSSPLFASTESVRPLDWYASVPKVVFLGAREALSWKHEFPTSSRISIPRTSLQSVLCIWQT